MRKLKWLAVILIVATLFGGILGCKQEVKIPSDKTAPADVTELNVEAANGNAVLSWTNPADKNFAGVQISMSPAEGTLKNAISLGKDVVSFDVSGLTIGKEYTFTIKAFDTSSNYSKGAEAKATVEDTSDKKAPAEVTELTVTASNGNAVLNWKNPADTDFAGVQVAISPAEGTLKNAVVLEKEVTSLDVSGLTVGTEYTFTVKTFDESLNYSEGAEEKATVADTSDKTAPANVTSLTVTASNENAVLSWKNPADTDFAGVQISMSPAEGTLKNAISFGKDVTSLDVSGLENGKDYTFTVKTFDTSLNYSEGAETKATVADTADYTAPATVTSLTVTAADGNAVLTWKNPADTDFAGVQISMSPAEGTLKNAVVLGKDVKSFDVSGLENRKEYTFTVKAFDTSLNYSEGKEVKATVKVTVADPSDKTAPADVTEFTVQAANGNAVLAWKNPADVDFAGVKVTMSPAEGTLENAVSLGKDVVSFDVSGLTVGKEYTFTVKAFDSSSNYSEGAEEKATIADTADYTAPADVTELTVEAANGNAVLSWKNPADPDFAGVQIAMSPAEGTLKNAVVLGKDVVSFDVSGLTVGKEYTFTVKAFDESLNYSKGAEATATVADTADYTAPADVTELTATNKDASVLLTWTDATDEDIYGYEVTWNQKAPINRSAAMESNSMMVAPGANGCYISNLTNGTEYDFTVKSVDISGNKSTGVIKTITPEIIEKSPLQITLEPNITERTNQDVVITVNATTDSASKIKKIAYKKGTVVDIDTVLTGTTATITKKITATKNDTFTVAVTDTAGRRELAFITVDNIDKTAPAQVTNVMPSYSRNNNEITLSWTNPTDEDFAGTEIVYGKTGSEGTPLTFDKNTTSATIASIADDDSEYTITIKTKDDLGNLSEAKTVTVVAVTGAKITSVNLDRTHLDSIMTNRDISVTISGSNFDLLSSLLVQVTDGSTAQTPVTATIDAANNTATATVTAPVPASPTTYGKTYTVKVIVDSTTPAETTASFVVSLPADVTNISLAQTQIKIYTQESVTATITGTNFDIRGVTEVKLLDSFGRTEENVTVPLESNNSNTEFTVDIPLPGEEGFYTVAVSFDDVKDTNTTTLQVYGTPIISEVTIPVAGTNYGGNPLPVTINGKNFTAPDVTASGFTSTGATLTNVKIVSDIKATAEVTCPYAVGTTNVTVSYGESSKPTTLEVIESVDSSYEVGDIILTNGKMSVANVETYTIDENNKPIGVVAMISDIYGVPTPKVIGLEKSELMWAPEDTTGYNTNFTKIVCNPSQTGSGAALTATFTEDTDGSDNWEEICAVDPTGTADAATNYPIFNFANTYRATAGLTGTDYENGWYVPSLAELCEVYKNKEVIQTSLTKAGGFEFGTIEYWSSSQKALSGYRAYNVRFRDGEVIDRPKNNDFYYVFVLQALTAK